MLRSLLTTSIPRQLSTSASHRSMELSNVLRVLNDFAPLDQAAPWDNVGLLVQPSKLVTVDRVLLTNDLTEAVMKEAIECGASLIMSYHPPIFKPLKSVTQRSWKERLVSSCLEHGIAVYSPHTAVDAKMGGVADWLLQPFEGEIRAIEPSAPSTGTPTHLTVCTMSSTQATDSLVSTLEELKSSSLIVSRVNEVSVHVMSDQRCLGQVIEMASDLDGVANVVKLEKRLNPCMGMGRSKKLREGLAIKEVIDRVKTLVGVERIRVALATNHTLDTEITSLASCAGSGGSLLLPCSSSTDVLITGEMSHHELLDAVHNGASVVLCEHNNSERRFLIQMAEQLKSEMNNVVLVVAKSDCDPVSIM